MIDLSDPVHLAISIASLLGALFGLALGAWRFLAFWKLQRQRELQTQMQTQIKPTHDLVCDVKDAICDMAAAHKEQFQAVNKTLIEVVTEQAVIKHRLSEHDKHSAENRAVLLALQEEKAKEDMLKQQGKF